MSRWRRALPALVGATGGAWLLWYGARLLLSQPIEWHTDLPVLAWWEREVDGLTAFRAALEPSPTASAASIPPAVALQVLDDEKLLALCVIPELAIRSHYELYSVARDREPQLRFRARAVDLPRGQWWRLGVLEGHAFAVPCPVSRLESEGPTGVVATEGPDQPVVRNIGSYAPEEAALLLVAVPTVEGEQRGQTATRVVAMSGEELASFTTAGPMQLVAHSPHSVGPSRDPDSCVVACGVTDQGTDSVAPEDQRLAVFTVKKLSHSEVRVHAIEPEEGFKAAPALMEVQRSCPAVVPGRDLVAYRCLRQVATEAEILEIASLHLISVRGTSQLVDFLARYHCEGPNRHEYYWTFDDGGAVVERWNGMGGVLEGWGLELVPSVSPDGSRLAYLKRGWFWLARFS